MPSSVENLIDIPGLGALLGLAVGDALGTTFEFARIDQPPYPTLATRPATAITGGGPFELVAGQVTDDTQLAVCLARSLAARRGLDPRDLAARYVAWHQHAFDVGNQTARALGGIEDGGNVETTGRRVWHESGRRAAGNGSLMRTAPIGVFFAETLPRGALDAIVEPAVVESLVTHADPRCAIACAAFDAAIASSIAKTGAPLDVARAAIPLAASLLRRRYADDANDLALVDAAVEDLERDLDTATTDNPNVYRLELDLQRTAGFVRVAFRLAFWHFVHTPSWRDAVVDVASRGGDADTNAAIVGALLGARDGARAIPHDWIECVLAVEQKGPPAWAEAHHPRHFLAFAEQLRT